MPVLIRPIEEGDVHRGAFELYRRSKTYGMAIGCESKSGFAHYLRRYCNDTNRYIRWYVAEAQEHVIGLAKAIFMGDVADIVDLVLSSDYMIGATRRELVGHVIKEAQKEGFSSVALWADAKWSDYYNRCGFSFGDNQYVRMTYNAKVLSEMPEWKFS